VTDPTRLHAHEMAALLRSGEASSRELTEAHLAAAERDNRALNAWLTIDRDRALAEADAADARLAAARGDGANALDRLRPLLGIPVGLKDLVSVAGGQATAGSRILEGYRSPYDAHITERLREAGAVILGKANLSEWANIRSTRSTSGWSAVGGLTRNPYVLDRNPCGSSSGSGVAVAAGMVVAAIGTETDGSIVCPASVNGVVGFKPTVGLVSRRGIVPIAHSQDTAGPMTRSVADAAILLDAIAGSDSADPATGEADARRTGFRAALDEATLRGRRIGVVRDHGGGAGEESKAILDAAVVTLKAQGAEIVDPVALPRSSDYSDDELAVLLFELRADLGEYLRERGTATVSSLADVIAFNQREAAVEMPWFGQELFLQAERNGGVKPAEYLAKRERIRRLAGPQGIDRALAAGRLDALVAITCGPAWVSDLVYGDNPGVSCSSSPAAIAGYPSASVPAGFVDGLPVGVSFTAGAWQDARVLAIAHAFERAHAARKPPTYRASVDSK
jgi:amidase